MKRVLTALAATLPFAANAADAISGAVERQPTNWQAIIMFLIFVVSFGLPCLFVGFMLK